MLCSDARRMLECTDMDIKEIADALGFSDQSVFGKFFMRKTGVSPLKFRMKNDLQRRDCYSPNEIVTVTSPFPRILISSSPEVLSIFPSGVSEYVFGA